MCSDPFFANQGIAFGVKASTVHIPGDTRDRARIRGRLGFDVGVETLSACRGTEYLVKPAVNLIVANDDNYALAA